MVNYLVAVDGSEESTRAFNTVMTMIHREVDSLFLIAVAERVASSAVGLNPGLSYSYVLEAQQEVKRASKRVLLTYYKKAKAAKVVHVTPLLGTSPHIGEAVCQAVKAKEIDVLLVGARGLGKFAQFFLGSTSKYLAEHAECNVMIVRHNPPPSEEHVSLADITAAEEEERERRITETKNASSEEEKHRQLDLHIAQLAEEEERWRRVHDHHEISEDDAAKHKAIAEAAAAGGNKFHQHLAEKFGEQSHYISLFEHKGE
jgi:nucleotide-binding universal stress UspA family protein